MRTWAFRQQFEALDTRIQQAAREAFAAFLRNPHDPSLSNHPLIDMKKGRHRPGSWAVSITKRYRAIYVTVGDTNVWYWIGSHSDYNSFVGRK